MERNIHNPGGTSGSGSGSSSTTTGNTSQATHIPTVVLPPPSLSRYESQKKRDWNTFLQYLKNHKPPLSLSMCSGAHVIEFLKYHDQFGKTKVHVIDCSFFGHPNPPTSCTCPLRQAWGSLDALIGRLRAAYEENGGEPESNPFGTRAVRIYLKEIRESQAKARGIPYEKKKRKRVPTMTQMDSISIASASSSAQQPIGNTTTTSSGADVILATVVPGEKESTSTSTISVPAAEQSKPSPPHN